MLRRLPLGFAGVLAAAIVIAACSSPSATQTISVGPNFATQTLYAANVTQNAVNIYATGSPVPASTKGPQYQIGGGNTTLAGPQYLTFDSTSDLWVTNWLSSTTTGSILEFKALATGDVLPFQSYSVGSVRPRGIVDFLYEFTGTNSMIDVLAVAVTDPSQQPSFNSGIQFYTASVLGASYETMAGPATGLNVPSGIAAYGSPVPNLYVANLQGQSVTEYALPSSSPTASPTPTPTASPSPTPSPTGATASPSPTPAPTPTPLNIAPIATISGPATGVNQPTGVALDANGNVYVSDQNSTICTPNCPAILIFAPLTSGTYSAAPTRFIAGKNTLLIAPTDVKVDKNGYIYVADEVSGAGVVYVFAPTASGNVAPTATLNSPGAVIGLSLTP